MSLAGFTHIGTYTLPTLAGTHTNFPVLLRYADFHPDVIAALKSDGSDLRVSTTDDTQFAHHVVRWNPASNDILVHCCVPSAATATQIKFWGDNASATMLDQTDPFGQYAAYNGWLFFSHDGTTDDSGTVIFTGSSTLDSSPFSGDAADFDGANDGYFGGYSGGGQASGANWTFSAMARPDALPSGTDGDIVNSHRDTATARRAAISIHSSGVFSLMDKHTGEVRVSGSTVATLGQWYHVGGVKRGRTGLRDLYVNGAPDAPSTGGDMGTQYSTHTHVSIGSRRGALEVFNGAIAHAGARFQRAENDQWFADHASNLTAVGAWGTMTSTGGGGATPIVCQDLVNANTLDITTLVQQSLLSVNELSQNNLLGNILLSLQGNIFSNNIGNGQTLDNSSLSQQNNILLQDIDNSNTLDITILTQNSVLTSQEITTNTSIDNSTLTQDSILSLQEVNNGSFLDITTLTQQNLLSSDPLDNNQFLDSSTLTQDGSISAQELFNSTTVDNTTLTQLNNLAVNSLLSGNTIDNTTLSQLGQLSVLSLNNNNTLDSTTLTQATAINVQSISQNMTLEQCALSVLGVLSVESLYHLSSTDVINLTQQSTLTVDDVDSSNALDNLTLIQNYLLSLDNISNNQLIDNITVQQKDSLILQSISSGTALDNTTLLQNLTLVVDPITNQQSLGVVFFGILPELESFLLTFEKDDISGSFGINIINITFGE